MSAYDQFVEFGVDSFGLERSLRLLHALAHITLSTPFLLLSSPLPSPDLLTLRSTLNLSRRIIRTFRFLSCFSAAQTLYFTSSSSSPLLSAEAWLDVTRLTLLGIYGLLETVTIPDLAGADVFGKETSAWINDEAQRLWFVALACGVVAGLMRLAATAGNDADGAGAGVPAKDGKDAKGEKVVGEGEKGVLGTKGRERTDDDGGLRGERNSADEKSEKSKKGAKRRALVRKMVVEAVDMCLPTSTLGWVEVDPALVGWAMFFTTVVSGYDVWKGVGAQMRLKASKA